MKRSISLIAIAVLAIGGASACGNKSQKNAPEPTPANIINGIRTQVIQMPDGFRNIAFTCYMGNGIYVTSRGWVAASATADVVPLPSGISVVAGDPACK